MMLLYNIVLMILCVPALLYFGIFRKRGRTAGFWHHAAERLGRWDLRPFRAAGTRPALWVHCASLGEVRAAEPLLRALTSYRIILTTMTLTGREYAQAHALGTAIYFVPFDFSVLLGPLMKTVRPACLLLVETELWPGMMHAALRDRVPLVLVNARMSAHSYPFYRMTRRFWQPLLAGIARVAARSGDDADRFTALGCIPERVHVTGNIKYDREFTAGGISRGSIGLAETDLIFIAGSTRDGEEALLVPAILSLRKKFPQLKVIIAPRHLHRIDAVERLLTFNGVLCVRRSRAGTATTADCMVLDTFGELQKLYAIADIAFVGGSLVSKGGQNPIEPAACGKPVLFGPDMANFEAEARNLEHAGGGFRVLTITDFTARLEQLLADPVFRASSGQKAAAAVAREKGAVARTLRLIDDAVAGAGESR